MRMPEPDRGHYSIENLNYSYVYTNIDNIEIHDDIAKDYITIFTSKRKDIYKPINLLSCYSKRHREKTRLAPLFIEIFLKEAEGYNLKDKLNIKSKKSFLKIISDWKAEDVDKLAHAKIVGDKLIDASNFDLQRLFDYFVRRNLTPFYPEDRSVGRVKESIYKFFERKLKIEYSEKWEEIIQIVLSDNNFQHFVNVLDMAKEKYKEEVIKRETELGFNEDWNVPESLQFGSNDIKAEKNKSIMHPFYSDGRWKTEDAFIEFLERPNNKIEWWFKNGDRDAIFFAVPYEENRGNKPFYVDFIVKLKDGEIGLFDTKAGRTLKDAEAKIDGLYAYIKSECKKGKKLFGGIVANTEPRNYQGRWVYFDKQGNELKDNDFNNWVTLEI